MKNPQGATASVQLFEWLSEAKRGQMNQLVFEPAKNKHEERLAKVAECKRGNSEMVKDGTFALALRGVLPNKMHDRRVQRLKSTATLVANAQRLVDFSCIKHVKSARYATSLI